jgi:hypothetical protein
MIAEPGSNAFKHFPGIIFYKEIKMSSKEQAHNQDKTTVKQRSPQPEGKKYETVDRQVDPDTILQRARLDPQALTPRDVVQLHRTIGNQAVGRLFTGTGQGQSAIQRQFPKEEEEELMMKPDIQQVDPEGGKVPPQVESAIKRARGHGQPLESTVQQQMSETMGYDFSRVRVHADSEADELNQHLSAKAFTTGLDIFFKRGAYDPGSSSGRELIAHELSHVVQQRTGRVGGNGSGMIVHPSSDVFEQEAEARGRRAVVISSPGMLSHVDISQATAGTEHELAEKGNQENEAAEEHRTSHLTGARANLAERSVDDRSINNPKPPMRTCGVVQRQVSEQLPLEKRNSLSGMMCNQAVAEVLKHHKRINDQDYNKFQSTLDAGA